MFYEETKIVVSLKIKIISFLFLLYAYFGPYMPENFGHRDLTIAQLVDSMFITTEGILGTPLQITTTYIFLFLFLEVFLVQKVVGIYLNNLQMTLAGKLVDSHTKEA